MKSVFLFLINCYLLIGKFQTEKEFYKDLFIIYQYIN